VHQADAVSVATSFDYALPIEQQIPLIAEAGFTHFSLGADVGHSEYLAAAGQRRLRRLAEAHGLGIDTIHGPRADQPDALATLTAAVAAAAALDVPVVVVHAGPFDFPGAELSSRLDQLLRTCEQLAPVLAQAGVHLALENVLPGPATDLVCQAVESLGDAHFGFCYDSSHDQIEGPRPLDLLARLRGRLIAVQLSDRIRDFVDHVLPGEGFIQWHGICDELRRARFDRPLLLEIITTHSAEKDPRRFLELAHRQAVALSREIREGR